MSNETEQGPTPSATPAANRFRSLLNSVLLFCLVVMVLIWFNVHLEPYAKQSLLFGGPLTLWGIWRVIGTARKVIGKRGDSSVIETFLDKPLATELLGAGIAISLLLLLSTSSVYFTYTGSDPREKSYDIEVVRALDSVPFLRPLQLSAFDAVQGRAFLWNWRSRDIQIRAVGKRIYRPMDTTLARAGSLRLRIPNDLEPPELHVLHIIPTGDLYNLLPLVKWRIQYAYSLSIAVNGDRFTLDTLVRQEVFTGCPERELRWAVSQADEDLLQYNVLNWWLDEGVPDSIAYMILHQVQRKRQLVPIPSLRAGDTVVVSVVDDSGRLVCSPVTVPVREGSMIEPVYLTRSP